MYEFTWDKTMKSLENVTLLSFYRRIIGFWETATSTAHFAKKSRLPQFMSDKRMST